MAEPMRIVIVEPMGEGGLIHYAFQMGEALSSHGAAVTLVTADEYELENLNHTMEVEKLFHLWKRHDSITARQAEATGFQRIGLAAFKRLRRVSRAWMLVREWIRLVRYLLHVQPDVVIFGKINFVFEALFLAYLRKRGLILADICHEFELREQTQSLFARLISRLYGWTFQPFHMVFLHAEANRRDFLAGSNVQIERTCVIPMGNQSMFLSAADGAVDIEAMRRRYGLSSDESVVMFFGNLTYSKGVPELVEAFARLPSSSKARLLIAGYPTKFMDLEALKRRVDRLGIRDRIIFDLRYIPIEEVPQLMALATVVAFPYRNSSQSGSLQMAYSFGKPVIATRVGGLPEVVEDGESGLLVDAGSIEQLTEAIQTFVDDPLIANRMGSYAQELSNTRFSWERIAAQVLEELNRLVSTSGDQ